MSTVTTTKKVNLSDLDRELGSPGLQMVDTGQERKISGPVAQATLQAAVDAHVWVDTEANSVTARTRLAEARTDNRTYLDLTSPTNAQNQAQIRALTRQNQRIIRLLLAELDGTD